MENIKDKLFGIDVIVGILYLSWQVLFSTMWIVLNVVCTFTFTPLDNWVTVKNWHNFYELVIRHSWKGEFNVFSDEIEQN